MRSDCCGSIRPSIRSRCSWVGRSPTSSQAAVDVPVTVKTRLGVDEHDSYEFARDFIATVAAAGCETFVVHARKAWLSGLSPKQNREIPPLDYERVHRLKRELPELRIVIAPRCRAQWR
jgi:tRNA-dihydrouridine synthase A